MNNFAEFPASSPCPLVAAATLPTEALDSILDYTWRLKFDGMLELFQRRVQSDQGGFAPSKIWSNWF